MALVATVVTLGVALFGSALPAQAAATLTVDQFVSTYRGVSVDADGAFGAQCVDLWRVYNARVVGGSVDEGTPGGGASSLWTSFSSLRSAGAYTTVAANQPARIGDVAVWSASLPGSGGYGHVAIVLADEGTTLKVIQQNYNGQAFATVDAGQSKAYLLGYLRPNTIKATDTDSDGIADSADRCPTAYGSAVTGGCPDGDKDGSADVDDPCPQLFGTVRGCPSDSSRSATSVDGYTFFTAIGADGHLYYKARGQGTWQSEWTDRGTAGGGFVGSPALTTSVDGYTFFTAIGADGHLYYKARGHGWWQSEWMDRGATGNGFTG